MDSSCWSCAGISLFGLGRIIEAPTRRRWKVKAKGVHYAYIQIGDICVYVADIEDDADETAIMQQIYARGMGWA